MITFLDCTLRDGGYYNDWDFELSKAEQLIYSLNDAGVQIIELGYKSPIDTKNYYGLFKNCNEDYLTFLSKDDASDYAFMIDVKEFITDGELNYSELDKEVRPAKNSIFSWVRLASHYATLDSIPEFVEYFKSKGYKIGFNLMGGSLLSDEQILDGLNIAKKADVGVFYIADSFGSFYPDDVRRIVRFIKKNYNGVVGIHTHDNQGMAYANTITAIEEGVEFIDGTVTGMGRGAGNLLTEQFLLGHSIRNSDERFDSSALLHIIETYIQPLKDHYKWGYNTSYMYSGLLNIHPTYGQQLSSTGRFTSSEIGSILAKIPSGSRKKYNKVELQKAIKEELSSGGNSDEKVKEFNLEDLSSDYCTILAKGPEAQHHISSIKSLSDRLNAPILECNHTGYLDNDIDRMVVILNQLKLHEWCDSGADSKDIKVVTGRDPEGVASNQIFKYSFQLGEFSAETDLIRIPDYDVGLYAIALAIASGVKTIFLAGFDGFTDAESNSSKEVYLQAIKAYADERNVRIAHITRSHYTVFDQQSLYTI